MSSQPTRAKFVRKNHKSKLSKPRGTRELPSSPGESNLDLEAHSPAESEAKVRASQNLPLKFIRIKRNKETPGPKFTEPDLVPSEFILDLDVRAGLAKPSGWDMYYIGSARAPDLNIHPAVLGVPTTRRGCYNIVEDTYSVVCP